MTTAPSSDLELPPRFREPEGWRWHSFTTDAGRTVRYGSVFPKGRIPDAVVVALPGVSEFAEKYFELAHDMLDRNLAFWVIDWVGQGRSSRLLSNRLKRHSQGFEQDIEDLHQLMSGYVKPASVHPDRGRIPRVMLAHSMGGHIGLRYLARYPEPFSCAAISAPLTGIRLLRSMSPAARVMLSHALAPFHRCRPLLGGNPVRECVAPGESIYSSDPVRDSIHALWYRKDPVLQLGGVTLGWVHEALLSCQSLSAPGVVESIKIPVLMGLAGQEKIVDNDATRALAQRMPAAQVIEFPEARHEILMERDAIRSVFLEAFDKIIETNIRQNEQCLKPF